ncbi:hypothetical protein SDC9_176183 [bioreactor metagenome]|uniref:ECF RNA polymerase sigma-E factor n=1 Tax=bioreactor metagenome TaxID=1076179 RepID=A0A645GP97_9ZZZZ
MLVDVVSGNVSMGWDAVASMMPLYRGNKLHFLGVSGTRRIKALPEVPTAFEQGYKQFEYATSWYGAYVSGATPEPVRARLQEAFIKAYRALPSFRGESAFYTWLYRIGINTAKNYLVSQGRRAPTTTEFDSEEAENFEDASQLRDINTPESLLLSKQIGHTVNAAMDSLPDELRTAIVLRELEGLSYEEIADIMHCPIGTVRSRIFRAREAVAAKLRPLLDTAPDRRW